MRLRDTADGVLLERCNHREIRRQYVIDSALPITLQVGAFSNSKNVHKSNSALPDIRWQHNHSGGLTQLTIGERTPLGFLQ